MIFMQKLNSFALLLVLLTTILTVSQQEATNNANNIDFLPI